MTTTTADLRITPTTGGPLALYERYAGQTSAQPCYVALDLRTHEVWAGVNHEIGNAVPADVWHGRVRRYAIPLVQPETANQIIAHIGADLARVLDGSEIVYDGSNSVGRLSPDAEAAEESIMDTIESFDSDVHVWDDPAAWLEPVMDVVRTDLEDGESAATVASDYQGTGEYDDFPFIDGLEQYIERLAEEVRGA